MLPVVKFKKLKFNASIPSHARSGDLGFDLHLAMDSLAIQPSETVAAETGIAVALPEGWGAFIKPRSSQGKAGITIFGGVVDHGYRGELIVLLHNANSIASREVVFYEEGDKIGQLVLIPLYQGTSVEVEDFDDVTARGSSGFGSTGR